MTTETTEMLRPVLTDEDVATLNETRKILEAIEKRALELGNAIVGRHVEERSTWLSLGTPTPISCGRVAEAADDAETALFNVLNLASSHRVTPLTDAQIHGDEEAEEEAAETPEMLRDDVWDEPGPDLSSADEHDWRL